MKREPSRPISQRRRESSGTGRRVETEPCSCLSSNRMIQNADATFSRAVMWAVHANADDNSRGCFLFVGKTFDLLHYDSEEVLPESEDEELI